MKESIQITLVFSSISNQCMKEGNTNAIFICKSSFVNRCGLTLHVKTIHFQERKYPCKTCDYKATQKSNLSIHIKAVHQDNERDKIKCTDCDYQTVRQSDLTKHRKLHSDNPINYDCNICTFKTIHKRSLIAHVKGVHHLNI